MPFNAIQFMRSVLRIPIIFAVLAVLSGCATSTGNSSVWRSIVNSASEPAVWSPLLGAAVIAATDQDQEISEWARDETPLFGSQSRANDASDRLRNFLRAEAAATSILVAYRQRGSLAAPLTAVGTSVVTEGFTDVIKQGSDRLRPDKTDSLSFPSGHTSSAFAYASLNHGHWRHMGIPATAELWLNAANITTAWGVAWARVEAGRHYATDVLAGSALGSFVARTAQRLFLQSGESDRYVIIGHFGPGEIHLGTQIRF
jgi:membrane-associated phospholipid phosphatase